MCTYMPITATDFRKDLFQTLEQVVQGEKVEVTYKGYRILLVGEPLGTKLSRAVRREGLLVDPQSIVDSDPELLAELESRWQPGNFGK